MNVDSSVVAGTLTDFRLNINIWYILRWPKTRVTKYTPPPSCESFYLFWLLKLLPQSSANLPEILLVSTPSAEG